MRLDVERDLVHGWRSEAVRDGGRTGKLHPRRHVRDDRYRGHAKRGAGNAGAPSACLAERRPRPHDRGFAVRPSDDPPDDDPEDDDPLDDDPPDDDGVGDGWDVCLGRSRAVAPVDALPGCV